ncbi:MAG TPA: F0F1 ATP synthase subunit delta [Chthoniobacteraceae bacterium]|jgi:F-type H+-transporting ATPase subunit delta|nr:F0F1 ATP synthase subunit delta [Chthoniobacteraceae bacterium]
MKIPKEARKISRELYKASLQDGRLVEDRVRTIAQHLVSTKPRHYANILKDYDRMVRLELAARHAVIESATELDGETRGQLEQTLRGKYGQDLTTEFKTEPALIGGLRIKIGSDVYDSTVRERLDRLDAALA